MKRNLTREALLEVLKDALLYEDKDGCLSWYSTSERYDFEALVSHLYEVFGLERFERAKELAESLKIEALAKNITQPAQYPPVIVVYTPPGTPPLSWPEITRMFK